MNNLRLTPLLPRLQESVCGLLILLGVLALVHLAVGGTPSEQRIRETVDGVFDETYQTELPSPRSADDSDEDDRGHVFVIRNPFPLFLARVLFYVFVVVALGMLVFFVADRYLLPRFRATTVAPLSSAGQEDLPRRYSELLRDSEIQASEGRFGEAIHTLLLGALAAINRRSENPLADSLTSREIVRLVDLPRIAEKALGELVTRVEVSHFGGVPSDKSDYLSCRESFERLAAACSQEVS